MVMLTSCKDEKAEGDGVEQIAGHSCVDDDNPSLYEMILLLVLSAL